MSLVWELDLPQNQKFVLLGFADFCNDSGRCFPSIARIAWKAGYSARQTQAIVSKLRKRRLLEAIEYSHGGRGRAVVYRLHPERGPQLAAFVPAKGAKTAPFAEKKGRAVPAKRARSSAVKGAIAASPQPPVRGITSEPPGREASAGADVALSPSERSARFMEIWNGHCGALPKVRELTKERRRKLAARCRERPDFEREFLAAVQKAAQTPFLLGETGRGWRASFDWLIRDRTNLVATLEGKYDGDRKQNSKRDGRIQLSREEAEAKYGGIKPDSVVH